MRKILVLGLVAILVLGVIGVFAYATDDEQVPEVKVIYVTDRDLVENYIEREYRTTDFEFTIEPDEGDGYVTYFATIDGHDHYCWTSRDYMKSLLKANY